MQAVDEVEDLFSEAADKSNGMDFPVLKNSSGLWSTTQVVRVRRAHSGCV